MWQRAKLKVITRFGYGDALPAEEVQEGSFKVFGSNGPYSCFSRSNTLGPAIIVGRKGSYVRLIGAQSLALRLIPRSSLILLQPRMTSAGYFGSCRPCDLMKDRMRLLFPA